VAGNDKFISTLDVHTITEDVLAEEENSDCNKQRGEHGLMQWNMVSDQRSAFFESALFPHQICHTPLLHHYSFLHCALVAGPAAPGMLTQKLDNTWKLAAGTIKICLDGNGEAEKLEGQCDASYYKVHLLHVAQYWHARFSHLESQDKRPSAS